MNKKKLKQWINILKDKNHLNVVFLYLNEYGGFNFVIDDDLLATIGDEATKKLLEIYNEGFKKSIEKEFAPPPNFKITKLNKGDECPFCKKTLE